MKKLAIIPAVILLVLVISVPVLATSLGVSPSHVELEVPGNGMAIANVQVHYFSGDVQITLVDIPLQVEPGIVHVDAVAAPEDVQLTIYGDESLGSQVYDGYIRFLGMSGETIAVAVKIRATVTNIVEGQPLPEPVPAVTTTPAAVQEDQNVVAPPEPPVATDTSDTGWLGGIEGLSMNLVIIIAAVVVFLGLVILAISMRAKRRKRYY